MASFTGVGDNTTLTLPLKGEKLDVAISGTYNMTILCQREVFPGAGAWITLATYTTEDATVAESFYATKDGEVFRLIVTVDTSGTATATLTNAADEKVGPEFTDRAGNTLMHFDQAGAHFAGNVTVDSGGIHGMPVKASGGTTRTLTRKDDAGKVHLLDSASGVAYTLPAATGTGDIYRFFATATVTASDTYVIKVANATDIMQGVIGVATDAAGVNIPTAATSDTLTMNGSTTGGLIGSYVQIQDVASGVFHVSGSLFSTGAEATPFSAGVS